MYSINTKSKKKIVEQESGFVRKLLTALHIEDHFIYITPFSLTIN